MSSIAANFIHSDGQSFVTIIHEGSLLSARDDHPNYAAIVKALSDGTDAAKVAALFDPAAAVAEMFEALSRRVSVRSGRLYFDGEEVHNALSKHVVRFLQEDRRDDAMALVHFFEKVQANPNEHSREQLYEWLDRHKFTITPEGDIVGYKGVRKTTDENGDTLYVSINHGPAIVDGVEVNGAVPNNIGSVIEMPRGQVQHDPKVGCSTGLHVGTWDYASDFAQGAVLEVHVNPTDVNSVPTDCGFQKMRTCRYTVVKTCDGPYSAPVLDTDGTREDDSAFTVGSVPATPKAKAAPAKRQPTNAEWSIILQEAKDRKKGVPVVAKKHGFVLTAAGARKQRPNAVRDRENYEVAGK